MSLIGSQTSLYITHHLDDFVIHGLPHSPQCSDCLSIIVSEIKVPTAIVKREELSEMWLILYWTSELTETGSFAPTRNVNHPHAYSTTVVCKAGHSIHRTSYMHYQLHDHCPDVAFSTDLTCPPVAELNGAPTSFSPSTNVQYYWFYIESEISESERLSQLSYTKNSDWYHTVPPSWQRQEALLLQGMWTTHMPTQPRWCVRQVILYTATPTCITNFMTIA